MKAHPLKPLPFRDDSKIPALDVELPWQRITDDLPNRW